LYVIVLGGRDTTAILMSAVMWEISRRPDMQGKLRQEIEETLGKRQPKMEDLKNMTYLNWLIKETLRLYPPVPMNFRRASRDTWLPLGGGCDGLAPIFVRKGQEVVYQIWSMHRRKDLWGEDAEIFRPERWGNARPKFEFLPFNAGPRICLGEFDFF
jgi:cytochrome P450